MENDALDIEARIDILKFIHQTRHQELQYLREREYKIFTWSSGLLTALIGALLIAKQAALIWNPYGVWGRGVASAAVVLIIIYSTGWLYSLNRSRMPDTQVLMRIEELLHCYDKGYFTKDHTPLLPGERLKAPEAKKTRPVQSLFRRLFGLNYLSATVLLGILTLVMLWVS